MKDLRVYEENNIYVGECSDMMSHLPDDCIDLTVTSPPYDNLRDYNGFTFDYKPVIEQLYRVTAVGGVVVWVVADATVKGSETGTSFRQALWAMECGFRLHDTMIYKTSKPPMSHSRYEQEFEYMFVFSKDAPKAFNAIKIKSTYANGKTAPRYRNKNGKLDNRHGGSRIGDMKIKGNIWKYLSGSHGTNESKHPASFPEALARDHIISWSNPGDIVLDPFMGSGTTAKMAMQNGRSYLGFDISEEYVKLAQKRVAWANPPLLVID